MQFIRCIKNTKLLTLIVFSLFLTGAFSVFASYVEATIAMQGVQTYARSDGTAIRNKLPIGEHMRNMQGTMSGSKSMALPEYVEGEVLVVIEAPAMSTYSGMGTFSSNTYSQTLALQAEAFASEHGLLSLNTFPEIASISSKSIIHLRSENKHAEELVHELSSAPGVVSVSPNYITKLSWIPNDQYYMYLWGMGNIGMPRVWDYFRGNDTVVVAVIDSGIDYNHPDINANMAKDSNGHYGRSVLSGVNSDDPMDTYGHGTHVAGTIGAVGNNGIGVAGVNWQVKMLAIKTFSGMYGSRSDIISGMNYVLEEKNKGLNIRVANMSFTGWNVPEPDDSPYGTAVKSLSDAGIICAIAASNENQDLSNPSGSYTGQRPYPACFKFENTITVGSITSNNTRSSFSNYSGEWVDIAAPGSNIHSTMPNNTYGTNSGTSMAAPHVAGVAALLFAAYPNESATQIKARILSRARSIDIGLWVNGTLNAAGAYGIPEITTPYMQDSAVGFSYSQSLSVSSIATITWSIDSGGLPGGLRLNSNTGEIYGTPTTAGTSNFTVKAENAFGVDTKLLSITVTNSLVTPTINTSSLPGCIIGYFYNQRLSARGTAQMTWSIESGNLPDGLALNSNTGEIYGTPTTADTFNFMVKTTNSAGSDMRAFTIIAFPVELAMPTITSHPQTQILAAAGVIATFSVMAAGIEPLEFQWQRSENGGNTWNNIYRANEDTYSITGQMWDDGVQLRVAVSNRYDSAISNTARLWVGSPKIITTAAELDSVRVTPNRNYKLGNDIDLTEYLAPGGAGYTKWGLAGWMPIGTVEAPFTGIFDGNGCKITGLWIDRPTMNTVGLFGYSNNAEIKKLGVEIPAIGVNGYHYVGGLMGVSSSYCEITNCYVSGSIDGYEYVGGLVGRTYLISIENCYAIGNVMGSGSYIGGLVGYSSYDRIENSYATGNISGGGYVGGLVGYCENNSSIAYCYATGNVNGGGNVGGIVGSSSGAVTNSYRYQFATVNGVVRTENTPNGIHGGIVSASQLMTKATYTGNSWLFNDSTPTAGPWYWDNRGFPKLNIGTESFPFSFPQLPFSGGGGTVIDPYIITTAAQLDEVRNYLSAHFVLSNDIDLSAYLAPGGDGHAKWGSAGWMPIGTYADSFTGTFNGKGHKIAGLWIDRSDADYVGLFGRAFGAEISNLGVEISIAGIKGNMIVGGLIGGQNSGSIENCFATGNVTGSGEIVGGLAGGSSFGSIENSYATGNVTGNADYVGGLAGIFNLDGRIENCYATGNVAGNSDYVGGLLGDSWESAVISCYATGNVSGNDCVGGLVGRQLSDNTITNSYATGGVIGNEAVGGLVGGFNFSSTKNSYATGNVTGSNSYVGGLLGIQGVGSGNIENCYATGNVTGSDSNVGGLVGELLNSNSITNSYRYQFATVNGEVIPASAPDSAPNRRHGGVMTAAELMTKTTYTGNAWLFNDSAPTAGPWHWDSRNFPKLNMGTEDFPFPWGLTPTITIITQPALNTTVTQGSISGNLSVSASVTQGATLTYQWYRNTTKSNAGGSIETGAGATSASFTIPTTLTVAGSPYYFYCVVSAGSAEPVHSDVATVTVTGGGYIPATGVTVSPKTLTITTGEAYSVQHEVTPANATNKNVTWHTSNASVATVFNGLVTGVAPGDAEITVKTDDGGFTDTCEVTVTGGESNTPPGISGPVYMELNAGYEATASNVFSITGAEPVTVTKTSGHASITWDDANKKLNIAAGLPTGSYPVVLTASNGIAPNATHTFTLTVINIPSGSAKLYFAPQYITAGVDRTFTITFKVDSEPFNQVECVLAYDPELLELEAVTQIPPSTDWMLSSNTYWGSATFSLVSMFGSTALLSGDTSIATLRFKTLNETSGTEISIIQLHGNGAGSSKLLYQVGGIEENIPFTTQGCIVTVVDGVATLKASFYGRDMPSAENIENLMVKWISDNVVIAEETVTADQNGEAVIIIPSQNSGLTIWVKGERTIAASQYIGTVEKGSVINIGTLPGGDSNSDNVVDLTDFNTFLNNYGMNSNSPGFNRFADFNNDGVVDLSDFNIFLNNYGRTGAQLPEGYSSSAMSMMSINEEYEESSVNEADSDSGCNAGMIGFALLMPVLPLFRKNK